ncbi:MAG: DUF2147 domain-containing protein [Pseudomonadota bacterium]
MRLTRTTLSAIALLLVAGELHAAPSPAGLWIDHTGRGAVEITQCGASLCGKIVWLKDEKNAKACGMQIIGNVRASGKSWGGGWIYSPERKSKYDVELTPIGDDKLKVFGFAGIRMFGQTMTWTRAPEDLPRCGETIAAPAAKTAPGAKPAVGEDPVGVAATGPEPVPAAGGTKAAPANVAIKPAPRQAAPVQTAEAEPEDAGVPEPAEPEAAETPKKDCKVRLPYVTLTFPCPK